MAVNTKEQPLAEQVKSTMSDFYDYAEKNGGMTSVFICVKSKDGLSSRVEGSSLDLAHMIANSMKDSPEVLRAAVGLIESGFLLDN